MCSLIAPQLWRRQFPEGPSIFPASHSQLLMSMKWESLSLWIGKVYLAQQGAGIIDLMLPRWGGWSPQGCFCKMLKVSARLGVFLFFPPCPHVRLPHKVWFSLTALSHTDDLVLLRPGMFVHWQAEDGRPQNSWILNQQLLLWEMRGWSHPPSGRDPGGRWVLHRLPVASCWHRGSINSGSSIQGYSMPREEHLSKTRALSLSSWG